MTTLLWLPLWVGILLLLLAIPVISSLPSSSSSTHHKPTPSDEESDPLLSPPPHPAKPNLQTTTAARFRTVLAILTNPSRNFLLLLTTFFLASLASSDTKLLPLYISKRYAWKFSSVGYLLSLKALFNFLLLSLVIPRFLRWRQGLAPAPSSASAAADKENARDRSNISSAHTCLVFSVLGALAIASAPTIGTLVPALLLYALGIALPMFTYSLLRSPSMALLERDQQDSGSGADGPGTQLFSVVMLVRTVGTLLGAVLMPALWVAGLGVGGWGLGMPYVVSAACYAVAGVVARRIRVG